MNLHVHLNSNGEITATGGLPRTIYCKAQDRVLETSKLSETELISEGWLRVIDEGRRDYDPDIESETVSDITVVTEPEFKAVRHCSYAFMPNVREALMRKVDTLAARLRGSVTNLHFGQETEHAALYEEAIEVIRRDRAGQFIDEQEFPFLLAGVNHTFDEDGIEVMSIQESASLVRNKRVAVMAEFAAIRELRLRTKSLIRQAASDDEAYSIFRDYIVTPEMTIYLKSDETREDIAPDDPEWNPNPVSPKNV